MNQQDLEQVYAMSISTINADWWSPYYYSGKAHAIPGFLLPFLITKASNYTCKSCGIKILQKYQVITEEPYRPTYHVKCYNALHESLIKQVTDFKTLQIDNLIPDEDKKEL